MSQSNAIAIGVERDTDGSAIRFVRERAFNEQKRTSSNDCAKRVAIASLLLG
ncbi:MAG: hypothetical protein SW833_20255 [Cyanobacteriota bacterium]|nr:hypothetical protein [Cyanobacteriota bacterium]